MEISDSSSDSSLSSEDIQLDNIAALAATTIKRRLKEKIQNRLESDVDSETDLDSDTDESADTSNKYRTHEIQFAIDKKPLVDVLDTCNSSRGTGFFISSPTDQQTSKNDSTHEDDKNCTTKFGHEKESTKRKEKKIELASRLQCNIQSDSCYVTFKLHKSLQSKGSDANMNQARKNSEEEIMKKSVITDDFEKKETIPPYEEGLRQIKKKRRLEREKTKGKNWFQMPAPEITEERKHDLSILQMRRALDPKRFYKGNDIKALPRYFQFGEVVETPADFYHARIPKKQRKATIVDELLADVETRKYNKRKYTEIQEAKRKGLGPYRHMKRLKKKKKH